jgi:hypothetical protein
VGKSLGQRKVLLGPMPGDVSGPRYKSSSQLAGAGERDARRHAVSTHDLVCEHRARF